MIHRDRSCRFMSGPNDPSVKIEATRWWLAISRNVMANACRQMAEAERLPASCRRTPTFVSPIKVHGRM